MLMVQAVLLQWGAVTVHDAYNHFNPFSPGSFTNYCLCRVCCLGVFSFAAQKPQPLCLVLITATSAQGRATKICCLGVFSFAAQKPQPLCLVLITATSAQGRATKVCVHD